MKILSIFIALLFSTNGVIGDTEQTLNPASHQDSCSDKCVGNVSTFFFSGRYSTKLEFKFSWFGIHILLALQIQ